MTNIFAQLNTQESLENIRTMGAKGIYNPGIHDFNGATIYLYESEWQGTTYTNAEIVLTTADGATLVDELRAAPKSNQTEATTDLLNYMTNLALVSGTIEALEQLKVQFSTLPTVDYKTRFKKNVKAKVIKIFANIKFKAMTYSELAGDANDIYKSERLVLNQVFRDVDGASLAEIKDKKEPGESIVYWKENEDKIAGKAQLRWDKKRDSNDEAVLNVILDHIQAGKEFKKDQRERIQGHFDVAFAKQVLSGAATTDASAPVVDEAPAAEIEEDPFG